VLEDTSILVGLGGVFPVGVRLQSYQEDGPTDTNSDMIMAYQVKSSGNNLSSE